MHLSRRYVLVTLFLAAGLLAAGAAAARQEQPSRLPIIDVNDLEALREQYGRQIIALGTVRSAEWSRTGRVMNIEFERPAEEEARPGLLAVVFENRRQAFDRGWGGDFGATIKGRRLRLRGEVREYGGHEEHNKGRPQMILNQPDQVTLLDP